MFDIFCMYKNYFCEIMSLNLAFISKVVERIVAQKLVSYLQEHDLLPRLQSAYRRSANHGRPRRRATPVVPISTTPASDGQIFTDFGGREDAGTRVRQ